MKPEPAEDGNVVVRLDGSEATGAARGGGNDGFAGRNAGDANIQETADDYAEEEKEERDHRNDFDIERELAQCAGRVGVSDG